MRLLITLAVLVAALVGCAQTPPTDSQQPQLQQGNATATPFPTAPAAARRTVTVERGTVQSLLEFTGRWLPRDQIRLSFPIDGTIRSVNIQRSSSVTAGQLLADYQITDLENQLAEQEIQLENAQFRAQSGEEGSADPVVDALFALGNANLQRELERNGIDWTGVANARIQLDTAQRRVDEAQRTYDDVISRPESSGSQIESTYRALTDAQTAVQSAQNSYFSAALAYNNAIARLDLTENSVLQRELALERAQSGTGTSFEALQAVRSAQNTVNQTLERIAQSSLVSPIDGVALSIEINPGDSVRAFVPVIVLAIPEPLEIIATGLSFNTIQQLSAGDVGVCRIPDLAVACVVRDVPLSSSDADQSVRIAATLPEATSGQAVQVQIPLDTREDVLYLPPGAVRTFQQRTFVIILTDEGEQVRDVVIGLRTPEREEILSGLEEGEVIVLP